MTRAEAIIATRLAGLLLLGLVLRPLVWHTTALATAFRPMQMVPSGLEVRWYWIAGQAAGAAAFAVVLLLGVFLMRNAMRISTLIAKETHP